jgi:hypothetical protein
VGRAARFRDIVAIPPLRDLVRQRRENAGRSGRNDQSRKDTGLKTGAYKSKPEKNRTIENQECGTRV